MSILPWPQPKRFGAGRRALRVALLTLACCGAVGCAGAAGSAPHVMQPSRVASASVSHAELETRCAGELCFTYAAD